MADGSTAPAEGRKIGPKVGDLENDLRNMILGNVTISNGHSTQNAPQGSQQHHSRGRGRGRGQGGISRGRGDGNLQAHTGRGQHVNGSWRGGHAPLAATRGAPHPQHSRAYNSSSATAQGTQSNQAWNNMRQSARAPQQPALPNGSEAAGTSVQQVPRLLQRPEQANINPSNAPHQANSARRYPGQYNRPNQHFNQPVENPTVQVGYLDSLAQHEIPKVEITRPELEENETFRGYLEGLCQKALSENYTGDIASISLVGFGSLASGFATPGSDMDLALVPTWKDFNMAASTHIDQEIPRLLEKAMLNAGMGARLLTRTRVPILKVCQNPSDELRKALCEERQKWDDLPKEEKYALSAPPPVQTPRDPTSEDIVKDTAKTARAPAGKDVEDEKATAEIGEHAASSTNTSATQDNSAKNGSKSESTGQKQQRQQNGKIWAREKAQGPLDFPSSGVGIQCDINFENPLGIHNTQLLRCYSLTDPRVRPMVLFVKAWAKRRKINSSYSGTLSSYGWVLMVLHYLVNIVRPTVCPNLQSNWRPSSTTTDMEGLGEMFKQTVISGYSVNFWRNEDEILHAARAGQLTPNKMSVGALLRGFFQYYSSVPQPFVQGMRPPSFYWTAEVLSLRTAGGLRSKADKGWTGAKTTTVNGKEVRNRYLFCIEDPFEIDHNVARTVTHRGIVAIRDEFRRAWRILSAVGTGQQAEGGIFDEIVEQQPPPSPKKPENETQDEAEKVAATEEHVGTGEAGEKAVQQTARLTSVSDVAVEN